MVSLFTKLPRKETSTPVFHTCDPLQSPNPIPNWSNNLNYISHLVSPFSPHTLFFGRSVLHTNLAHQRVVTGSTGSSVAGGTGNLMAVAVVGLAN